MTEFENKITPLTNGDIVVNKLINYKFKIGDYLIYDKQQKFYYNFDYAEKYNLLWDPEKIAGYVAKDEINFDNTESDKTTIIKIRQYNE
jgi:hypothetical protein